MKRNEPEDLGYVPALPLTCCRNWDQPLPLSRALTSHLYNEGVILDDSCGLWQLRDLQGFVIKCAENDRKDSSLHLPMTNK